MSSDLVERANTALENIADWERRYGKLGINLVPIITALRDEVRRLTHRSGGDVYPNIGQPCSGTQCAGEHPYCPDCEAAVEEFERDRWAAYYATISLT